MDDGSPSARSGPGGASSRRRLATVIDAQRHHRPIVVVLGMHRSGTSLCSNVLSVLGADMADHVSVGRGNDRGHWERWEIVGFHDRILEHFNRRYSGTFHDFSLPSGWWAQPPIVAIRRQITAFLRDRMGDGFFGFKDPRTVRLLPLWRHIFAELSLSPRIVLCLRKPAEVARSLQVRDGLDPCAGEYRWLIYLTDFFRHIGDSKYCTIEYESWFDNINVNVSKLQNFLGLYGEQASSTLDQALQEIIDPALRHDAAVGPAANEPIVRRFYELVLAAGQDGAARREIDQFIAQFDGWERLQRGFRRAYEAVSASAERIPDLEAEIAETQAAAARDGESLARARDEVAAHQARVDTLEAEREAAEVRAMAAEADLVQVRDEVAAHQARVGMLEAEREAAEVRAMAAEADLVQAQDEVAAHQARVGTLEAERAEILADSEKDKRDHAAALAHLEQRITEAAAAEASLRGEVVALGRQLSEALDRASYAEATSAELRRTMAQAEERARQAAAEAASVRDEVTALRERLGAARAVSARLAAAFRADLCSALPSPVVRRN